MRTIILLSLAMLNVGCSTTTSVDITSHPAPTAIQPTMREVLEPTNSEPFCLNIKFHSNNYLLYVENYAEASTTTGSCQPSGGTETSVDSISMHWRYKTPRDGFNHCPNTSICTFSERMYVKSNSLYCLAASAKRGSQVAANTTNPECQIP